MKKLFNYFFPVIVLSLIISMMPMQSAQVAHANKVAKSNTLYEEVYENLSNYKTNFEVQYTGDTKTLNAQLNKIIKDVEIKDRYLFENISNWKISMSSRGNSAKITFQINYLITKAQEDVVNVHVAKVLPTLVKPTDKGFDKVKAVHDYVVKTVQYSEKTVGSQYSTHTLLTEKKAVCQAYALLMFKMLNELGVEVQYVKGAAGNATHAWNLVKVDGEWYHIDATWNDPIGNKADQVGYKYFLLSDSQIEKTHTWTKDLYPQAKSTKYSHLHVAKTK